MTPDEPIPKSRRVLALLPIVLLAIYAAVLWNANDGKTTPMLVFTSPLLNTMTVIVALLLPLPVFVLICVFWRGVLRGAGAIVTGLLVPPSLLLALLIFYLGSYALRAEADGSFERLRQVQAGRYVLAVYRTNGGATTSYGIVVRQELPLIVGLRLVRTIFMQDHASDAALTVNENGVVYIKLNESVDVPEPKPLRLAPFQVW